MKKKIAICVIILVVIVFIQVWYYIYNNEMATVTGENEHDSAAIELNNSVVEKYIGDTTKGAEVKAMIEDIISYNDFHFGELDLFISIEAINIDGFKRR